MASTFLGIEIAKRGILSHQTGLNTVSHNLANSSNENYSRQEVKMKTMPPLYPPAFNREMVPGQIGQGSTVASIERARDEFVDARIVEQTSSLGKYDIRYKFTRQIEQIFNEPGQPSLKQKFDDFVRSWNDVALNPEEDAPREALVVSSQNMLGFVKDHYDNLLKLRGHVDSMIRDKVDTVNHIATELRDLNTEILKVKAMGDNPNDLLDRRDTLIEKLSKITDVKVVTTDPDEIYVYVNSRPLVQGTEVNKLEVVNDPENNGMASIIWQSGDPATFQNGELKALLEVRDQDILNAMRKLDNFVINLADTVNGIHREGVGLDPATGLNFFAARTITGNSDGNYDANKDGQMDQTRIYKVVGTQKLDGKTELGEGGFINLGPDDSGKDIIIGYKATDKVQDVIDRINLSKGRVNAFLDQEGRLVMKALYSESLSHPDFAIRHLEDTGHFLTTFTGILSQSGNAGAFDYRRVNQANTLASGNFLVAYEKNASMWMSVDEKILNNSANIATRLGKDTNGDGQIDIPAGRGDARNAFRIVSSLVSENEKNGLDINTKMDHMPVMVDKNVKSFRPFLDSFVAKVGEQAKSDKMHLEKENALVTGLINLREKFSGVNVDEELVTLIKYQHGYQASAKIMNTLNDMLDIIMKLGR